MASQESFARAAALAATAGLFFLMLFSAEKPREEKVSGIASAREGNLVLLKGKIESARQSKGNIFFELNDGNRIRAVVFNATAKEKEILRKGNFVEITGRMQEYKGELEITVVGAKKIA